MCGGGYGGYVPTPGDLMRRGIGDAERNARRQNDEGEVLPPGKRSKDMEQHRGNLNDYENWLRGKLGRKEISKKTFDREMKYIDRHRTIMQNGKNYWGWKSKWLRSKKYANYYPMKTALEEIEGGWQPKSKDLRSLLIETHEYVHGLWQDGVIGGIDYNRSRQSINKNGRLLATYGSIDDWDNIPLPGDVLEAFPDW